jgi:hypothetical protein
LSLEEAKFILIHPQVFDVIGEVGGLCFAVNQDDPLQEIGWIWPKHFAGLAPEHGVQFSPVHAIDRGGLLARFGKLTSLNKIDEEQDDLLDENML